MNNKTKRMICLLIGIASVLTIIGTMSYAYFTAVGEVTPEQAAISTGMTRVTFSDNDIGITGQLAFGESITKRFTIENTGTVDANVKMYWKDLINTYGIGSLTYTLSQTESENGNYTEIVSKTNMPRSSNPTIEKLVDKLTIPVGSTYYYNLEITLNYLSDVNQDADINAKFSSSFSLEDINYKEPEKFSLEKIIALSQGVRTNFDDPATTDEGIFEMQDDYGTSYYYRGAVENNYVKYGINKDGQEMWWRIIRINGDGSIRMIYDGTQGYPNGKDSADKLIKTKQPYSTTTNDTKYIGWMYGPSGTTASTSRIQAQNNVVDSDIKKIVDSWYKENIIDTGYGTNVSDEIFCNDRSIPGKTQTGWSYDTGLGYGKNATAYGAYARMKIGVSDYTGANPILECPQKNDAFTVDDTNKGNGALTYPVGLITADEIVIAGSGKYNIYSTEYYLAHRTYVPWTITPFNSNSMFIIDTSGGLNSTGVSNTFPGIAPVINLSADYANSMVGSGEIDNPYHAA